MKPFVTVALGALTLAFAAPALAQPMGWDIDRRENWLADRVGRGAADGSLDPREAHRVHEELRNLQHEEEQMRLLHHGQLREENRVSLEHRLDDIARQIHWLRENNERTPWWR